MSDLAQKDNTRKPRTRETTSKIMRAVKSKDSKAERALAKAMWAKGLRYRKHVKGIAGTPDFAFIGPKIAVFCDGDFWHGRGWEKRGFKSWEEQFTRIKTSKFWRDKILANMERDKRVNRQLEEQGWIVFRFLESDIFEDTEKCAEVVRECVEVRRSAGIAYIP